MKKTQDKSDIKNEILTLRVSTKERNDITTFAENNNMSVSEFMYLAIKEKLQTNKLMDSQAKLINVLETGFKQSYEPFFKRLMAILNTIDFNSKVLIKQQDIFMYQLKVTQAMEEIFVSPISHPITEKAQELVLKDLHKMVARKKEFEDEQE